MPEMETNEMLMDKVLQVVSDLELIDTLTLRKMLNEMHDRIIDAVKDIEKKGKLLKIFRSKRLMWQLTEEGEVILNNGSPEVILFNSIPEGGIDRNQLFKSLPIASLAFNKAMYNCWISFDKRTNIILRRVNTLEDVVQGHMKIIQREGKCQFDESLKNYYMRKNLIEEVLQSYLILEKGTDFASSLANWENKQRASKKRYSSIADRYFFNLINTKSGIEQLFNELGFINIPPSLDLHTNPLIETFNDPELTSYEVFSLESSECVHSTMKHMGKIKVIDRNRLWRFLSEAEKNEISVPTTCTVPVSARILYPLLFNLNDHDEKKYYYVEALYKTQIPQKDEFHQVEAVVVGYDGLTSETVMKRVQEFFAKVGIRKISFMHVDNEYTVSSMEIYGFHDRFKCWIKIGNCGIIRPETLNVLIEAPKQVNVFAWGISLERLVMFKFA